MIRAILFNTEMVQALLEERKTATRRLVRRKELDAVLSSPARRENPDVPDSRFIDCLCTAPYEAGDILWVRETWQEVYETEWSEEDPSGINIRELILNFDSIPKVEAGISSMCKSALMKPRMKYFVFKASNIQYADNESGLAWRPSIHMPKEAARIFLKVTDVHAEKLREMVLADVLMEGIQEAETYEETWDLWHRTWDSCIKPSDLPTCGWQADPWVWVIRFERCERPEMGARA